MILCHSYTYRRVVKPDNSAKYKMVGFGTRRPCAAKTDLGFGVIGKGFLLLFDLSKRKTNRMDLTKVNEQSTNSPQYLPLPPSVPPIQ